MSYRIPEQRKHIYDVSSKCLISVDNGVISRITIPCLYDIKKIPNRHHRMMHDHLGWPSPDHPDNSCQLYSSRDEIIITDEINLPGEGYDSIDVALLDPPEGLSVTGDIEYSRVLITISAMCESVTKEDALVPFSIFAVGTSYPDGMTATEVRDIVTKGTLRIVAGPIN